MNYSLTLTVDDSIIIWSHNKKPVPKLFSMLHHHNSPIADPDPMTIWNNLITIHSSCGCSTIIALCRRFHCLCLKHTETMSTYVAWVWHVAFLLEEADVTVTDDDIILAITSGLPRLYDSFLISLDATPDDDYTLAYVIACLVNE